MKSSVNNPKGSLIAAMKKRGPKSKEDLLSPVPLGFDGDGVSFEGDPEYQNANELEQNQTDLTQYPIDPKAEAKKRLRLKKKLPESDA